MERDIGSEKLRIGNLFIYVYILYTLFVVITEWINFVLYLIGGNDLDPGIAECFSFIVIVMLSWFKRNIIQVSKVVIDGGLITGTVVIFVLGIIKSAFPDGGFDTFNYHLISQNPKFENYFVEDFGYGNFQVWGFRLGDRLFYYFRYLLGYRFGTFLNTLVLVICFIQIYDLLDIVCANHPKEGLIRKFVCSKWIWSLAILFSMDALMMYGSYYVDAVAMPLALEMIRLVICDHGKKVSVRDIAYFALLNGLCIGVKLTNIVYVVPCVLIYLFMHIKDFKILYWIVAILSGLFPFVEYVVFNCLCTGNPVFPYFNALFMSPYFSPVNWKDERFGGKTLIEKLWWIWSLAFNPEYRKCEIWDEWNGVLIIGLIGTSIIMVYFLFCRLQKKRVSEQYIQLAFVAIISALIWSFTTGYSRYYMVGRVFWGILAFYFVAGIMDDIKCRGRILAFVCFCIAVSNTVLNINTNLSGTNWSWQKWSWEGFRQQMGLAFDDNDIKRDYSHRADLFVVTDHMSMGAAELIDGDVYTINMNYLENMNFSDLQGIVADKIDRADAAYDIHKRIFSDIYEYAEKLNRNSLYAVNIESIDISVGTYQMISVENLNGRKNTVWTSDEGVLERNITWGGVGRRHLRFIGGRVYDWQGEKIKLVVSLSDGVNERQAATVWLDNSTIEYFDIPLEIAEKECIMRITPYYESGSIVEADQIDCAFCMNLVVE